MIKLEPGLVIDLTGDDVTEDENVTESEKLPATVRGSSVGTEDLVSKLSDVKISGGDVTVTGEHVEVIDLTSPEYSVIDLTVDDASEVSKLPSEQIDESTADKMVVDLAEDNNEYESAEVIDLTTPEHSVFDLTGDSSDTTVKIDDSVSNTTSCDSVRVINLNGNGEDSGINASPSFETIGITAIKEQLMNVQNSSKDDQITQRQRIKDDVNSVIICQSVSNLIRKFA